MKFFLILFSINFILLNISCRTQSAKRVFKKEFSELKFKANETDEKELLVKEFSNIKINDSINTNIKMFQTKIETENHFINSNTKTKITFYESNCKLKFIRIKEESKKYKDTDKYVDYIIENNLITDSHIYYGVQLGIAWSLEKSYEEQTGLNKYLDKKFYGNFALNLYHILKKNYS